MLDEVCHVIGFQLDMERVVQLARVFHNDGQTPLHVAVEMKDPNECICLIVRVLPFHRMYCVFPDVSLIWRM